MEQNSGGLLSADVTGNTGIENDMVTFTQAVLDAGDVFEKWLLTMAKLRKCSVKSPDS